jgi:hypothetical protein
MSISQVVDDAPAVHRVVIPPAPRSYTYRLVQRIYYSEAIRRAHAIDAAFYWRELDAATFTTPLTPADENRLYDFWHSQYAGNGCPRFTTADALDNSKREAMQWKTKFDPNSFTWSVDVPFDR